MRNRALPFVSAKHILNVFSNANVHIHPLGTSTQGDSEHILDGHNRGHKWTIRCICSKNEICHRSWYVFMLIVGWLLVDFDWMLLLGWLDSCARSYSHSFQTKTENFGWSFVFLHFLTETVLNGIEKAVANAEWWLPVPNATWRTPEGRYLLSACIEWLLALKRAHMIYGTRKRTCKMCITKNTRLTRIRVKSRPSVGLNNENYAYTSYTCITYFTRSLPSSIPLTYIHT